MRDTITNDLRKPDIEEKQIDLVPLILQLLKRLWVMILVGAIFGAAAYSVTKVMIKPVYRSGFTAYVNNAQQQTTKDYLTSSDMQAAQLLVHTYETIIKSNTVLTAAAESLGLDESYASIKGKVSTQIEDETEIVTVYVSSTSPEYAYDLASAIAKIAPKYLANIVDGSSMRIIDYPELPDAPYKPSYLKYGILAALVGALLVAVIVIIRFMTDEKVKTAGDIEEHFGIPILGVIPDITQISKSGSAYEYRASSNTSNRSEGRKGRK